MAFTIEMSRISIGHYDYSTDSIFLYGSKIPQYFTGRTDPSCHTADHLHCNPEDRERIFDDAFPPHGKSSGANGRGGGFLSEMYAAFIKLLRTNHGIRRER